MADGRTPRIGLVLDHPARDLDGVALVAHTLALASAQVVIVPFYAQHLDVPQLDLDMLVVNYARAANLAVIREARRRGIAVAVLDTEGGLLPTEGPVSAQGLAEFLRDSGLDREIALYMFWGSHLRDIMLEITSLTPERAALTGCPRFDMAHAPYAAKSGSETFVLIATNFPAVNPHHAAEGGNDTRAMRAVGFAETEIAAYLAYFRNAMERFTAAVAAIAAARPDRRFMLRPHPFEKLETYTALFADLPNVAVRREGTSLDVLAQSEALLHINCTTAIEAVLCGVPPITLTYANEPALAALVPLPTTVSFQAESHSRALALLDSAAELARSNMRAQSTAIDPFFGPADGHAAERAAAAILQSVRSVSPHPPAACQRSIRTNLFAMAGATIGSRTIEGLRSTVKPARRSKQVTAQVLARSLARIARAEGVPALVCSPARNRCGMPMQSFTISNGDARSTG